MNFPSTLISTDDRRGTFLLFYQYWWYKKTVNVWLVIPPRQTCQVEKRLVQYHKYHFLLSSIIMIGKLFYPSYHEYWWYEMSANVGNNCYWLCQPSMLNLSVMFTWHSIYFCGCMISSYSRFIIPNMLLCLITSKKKTVNYWVVIQLFILPRKFYLISSILMIREIQFYSSCHQYWR